MRIFDVLLCKFGYHGPLVLGVGDHPRSRRVDGLLRRCDCCGVKWAGANKFVAGCKITGQLAWRELPTKA